MKPIKQSDLMRAIGNVLQLFAQREPQPAIALVQQDLTSLRVLLAEDNLVNQRLAFRLLEKRGHSTHIAGTGKEALQALERQSFDLVLMDVEMPEMGGFEATGIIREKEKTTGRHIPIIAMTAHALKGDRERCLAAGMDGYVAKPIQAGELWQVIGQLATQNGAVGKTTQASVLNEELALKNAGGDPTLLKELIEMFLDQCPKWMSDLRAAVAQRDTVRLQRAAHTIRGGAGNLAANAVAEAAQQLETLAQNGNLADVAEPFSTLETEIARLMPELTALGG
jgi:CheY-like chemotaxis protein/HPt (histidine-containing phosphotransfer) domain-containing protein